MWLQSDSARSSLNASNGEAATMASPDGEDKEEEMKSDDGATNRFDENAKTNAPSSPLIKGRGTKRFPGRISSSTDIAGMATIKQQNSVTNSSNNNKSLSPAKTTSANANDLLLRFFDSEFFDEWIAISYLWRAKNENRVEYLCNKMLLFDDERAERYLSQILTLLTQRKMPKLENVVCAY